MGHFVHSLSVYNNLVPPHLSWKETVLKCEEVYKWFAQDCIWREQIIERIKFRNFANFCQIREMVNLILTKFLYFFDSQNKFITKSNFLKLCLTCSSQNLILAKFKKYVIFPSRSCKILLPRKFIPLTRRAVFYETSPPSCPPSLTLQTAQSKLLDGLPIFDFLLWLFSSMHVIPFE